MVRIQTVSCNKHTSEWGKRLNGRKEGYHRLNGGQSNSTIDPSTPLHHQSTITAYPPSLSHHRRSTINSAALHVAQQGRQRPGRRPSAVVRRCSKSTVAVTTGVSGWGTSVVEDDEGAGSMVHDSRLFDGSQFFMTTGATAGGDEAAIGWGGIYFLSDM
ncbi:hypothetical protein R6Q59_011856 [Mikania micrantha]